MATLRNADLESAYRDLLRAAATLGVNVGRWDLLYGQLSGSGRNRIPWEIVEGVGDEQVPVQHSRVCCICAQEEHRGGR